MQQGRKRGTDWEGQQRERVRTERVECGRARTGQSGTGAARQSGTGTARRSGTGAARPSSETPDGAYGQHRSVAHGQTLFFVDNYFVFSLNVDIGSVLMTSLVL